MEKKNKTNAMRELEKNKIPYEVFYYESNGAVIDGVSVAQQLNCSVAQVFKTLVTKGNSGQHYVMVVPVAQELDLKKAARLVQEKSLEMIPVKSIQSVTGYIRGGCSPVGMKKQLPTVLDESAQEQENIIVSAGKIGMQIKVEPKALAKMIAADFGCIVVS